MIDRLSDFHLNLKGLRLFIVPVELISADGKDEKRFLSEKWAHVNIVGP